jgi:hypothetical protein
MPRKARKSVAKVGKRRSAGHGDAGHGFVWRLAIREAVEVYDEYLDDAVELKFGQDDPASIAGLVIDFRYYARDGEVTRRSILCQYCGRAGNRFYIRGYCPFREELRTFRVDRMSDVIAILPDKDVPIDSPAAYFAAFAAAEAERGAAAAIAGSDGRPYRGGAPRRD